MQCALIALPLLCCTLCLAAEEANIAYAATVHTAPAVVPQSEAGLVDGNVSTTLTFEVGTEGEGIITLTFDQPREVSGVRLYQVSEVYYTTAYAIRADVDGDGDCEKVLAEANEFPLNEWVEHRWEPLAVKSIVFRSLSGVSKGKRAHPVLAEFQVVGRPQPDDLQKAAAAGVVIARLPAVRDIHRETALVVNGRAPAVMVPQEAGYQAAARELLAGLDAMGIKADLVRDIEAADPAGRTVICLGNMLNNPLIERLYWNRYTFADALVPGPGRYLLHTVYDPYPYNGGQNVIVIGCSDVAGATPGADCFLQSVREGTLPPIVTAGPQPAMGDEQARKIATTKPDPTFVEFTTNANLYLQTGVEACARKAVAAMQIMADLYAPGGERHDQGHVGSSPHRKLPWPEETSSWEIECAWDAFEECPLISDQLRLDFTNALLQFTRDLISHVSGYSAIGKNDLVSWNHTTFPLLGIHFGARYFYRYYRLPDMPAMLEKAKACFLAQAKSWKPQEDADSYLTLTTAHSQIYSLAENDVHYFEAGNLEKYADYMVGICDNTGLASGFGDSGVSSNPSLPQKVLPLALWWTRDGGYKWLLQHYTHGTWQNPYERGIEPVRPDRFTGVNVFMTDPQVYEWVQTYPTYNEPFAKADVPIEESFDKISFRENWEPDGQYLLLDGHSRGKHLHYDGNSIIEFVEGGERWLLDHDYLTRNTTEHTMLSILRAGRCDQLVPSLSGLTAYCNLPGFGYSDTYTKGYNSCDWRRQILWRRGEWFLVADTVIPSESGSYDLDLTWKTLDEAGLQRIENGVDFVAERGSGSATTADCSLVEDEEASGGKALLMGRSTSRIAFGVDLPAGQYSLAVIGYGIDGSSDSLWVSVDLGANQAFHMNKGRYGRSASDYALSSDTPKIALAGDGPHSIVVTLREKPPIRVDRFILQDAAGQSRVYEAESLPPPPETAQDLSRTLHIRPATALDAAWVTNHERAGITVPVSILHQRKRGELQAGEAVSLKSLMYVSRPAKRRELTPVTIAQNLVAIGGSDPALAILGDVDAAGIRANIRAGLLTPQELMLSGLTSLNIADVTIASEAPVDLQVDVPAGTAVVSAPDSGTTLRITGRAGTESLPVAGKRELKLEAIWAADVFANIISKIASDAQPQHATRVSDHLASTAKPSWSAFDPGSHIGVLKVADLHDGKGRRVFVGRGPFIHCLDAAGNLLWTFPAKSIVRDIAFGDVRQNPGDEVLVGSADTYVYILSADGELLDEHQMHGTPWARSFGDQAYGVFNLLVGDITGDGVPDIVVSLANFDVQALSADWKLLWKYDHALHGSMQMSFEDTDADGSPDAIFVADKYGSTKGVSFDGSRIYQRYTSIGDVCYAAADLDGDGKLGVVSGSSTGDVVATAFADQQKVLWSFNNFGYAANRLRAADLNGDGSGETVLASGTGYLYVLDGSGKVLWQDRVGLCVNDAVIIKRPGGNLVAYCDEGGIVRVADAAGRIRGEMLSPAPPRILAQLDDTGEPSLLVGLADGRVLSYSLP